MIPYEKSTVVGTTAAATPAHADQAAQAAARALPDWRRRGAAQRGDLLRRLADLMRRDFFELAAWEVFESAKPWREATADVCEAIDFCDYYAHEAERLEACRGADVPGEENRFVYLPRGVAAVIAPWNFPLAILTGMTAAGLATGNTVVMKPAEQSPIIASKLMQLALEAGIPAGALHYLPGLGESVGAALVKHPQVSLIAFTGSKQVGLAINAEAAAVSGRDCNFVKRVIAEMGGKNAIIVDRDADLDEAVAGVIYSAFGFQGQKCSACSRAVVLEEVYDTFLSRLVEATRSLPIGPAEHPGTIPDIVAARIEAEANQSRLQDGFTFKMRLADGSEREVTPNEIDEILRTSTDLDERLRAWEAAKSIGPVLRDGLLRLRDLRNAVAREMGYPGFFSLQVADYGMTADEMMELTDRIVEDVRPLYEQLHCFAKRELAKRYGAEVPKRIPAHWLPNRWGQEWPGLVESVDLDPIFANLEPQRIVSLAEDFYVSMGFPRLPQTFWERSDLYELPADAPRKKNRHASAWHIDLQQDVRSLMSVKPDFNWFTTAHHELGHIYYYLSYSRPDVPPLLREGANRAFHEGIGELISLAASQRAYLEDVGLLPKDAEIDRISWLLNDALTSIVFLPWSAGVMSRYEFELYDGNLPAERLNARWWELKRRYQGIDPPSPRGEEYCDPATKTHINDDPAQYYDYAIATVLKFQLHEHIAKEILHQDLRNADYRGSREVGDFLRSILELGATRDWREVVREATGEDLSGRAMLEYYAPLLDWLKEQNQGCDCSFE